MTGIEWDLYDRKWVRFANTDYPNLIITIHSLVYHSTCKSITTHINLSLHEQIYHYTHKSITPYTNLSLLTYKTIIPHTNLSLNTYIYHSIIKTITPHTFITQHTNLSVHAQIYHFAHKSITPHINLSLHTHTRLSLFTHILSQWLSWASYVGLSQHTQLYHTMNICVPSRLFKFGSDCSSLALNFQVWDSCYLILFLSEVVQGWGCTRLRLFQTEDIQGWGWFNSSCRTLVGGTSSSLLTWRNEIMSMSVTVQDWKHQTDMTATDKTVSDRQDDVRQTGWCQTEWCQ